MAISNPKRRIGEIIEKARHFVRIGDEQDNQPYITKAEVKMRDLSNQRKNQNNSSLRPSSHMRTQDYRAAMEGGN